MRSRIFAVVTKTARWCSLDAAGLSPASPAADPQPARSFGLSRRLSLLILVLVIAGGAALCRCCWPLPH